MESLGQYMAMAALLTHGVWLGVAVADAVLRVPIWARMPVLDYAVDFRRHILRVDPMQPILAVTTTLVTIPLALRAPTAVAPLLWTSVVLMLLIIVASIVKAEPANSKFRRLPEGTAPEGAEQLRAFWARFHRIRTVAGAIAYVCLVLALGRLIEV